LVLFSLNVQRKNEQASSLAKQITEDKTANITSILPTTSFTNLIINQTKPTQTIQLPTKNTFIITIPIIKSTKTTPYYIEHKETNTTVIHKNYVKIKE
jgi:hypothetical protein